MRRLISEVFIDRMGVIRILAERLEHRGHIVELTVDSHGIHYRIDKEIASHGESSATVAHVLRSRLKLDDDE